MHRSSPFSLLFFFLVLASTGRGFADGLYWESTSTGGALGGKASASKSHAMAKKFKREDDDSIIIMRLDKEAMYMLRPKEKTYSEITFAEMESAMKSLGGKSAEFEKMNEKLKEQLKGLTPEQRAIVEKQLGSNPLLKSKDVKVEVTKTDEKKTITGRSCTKYVAKEDGKEVLTAWATTEIKEFEALRQDYADVMKRMTAINPLMGKGRGEAFQKIEGFPLETDLDGVRTIVTKVEKRAVTDADFDVPEGYTKTKSPFQGLQGPGPKPRKQN